jgi:hypothetical protein
MTEERLVLADLLEKAGDGDFLRAVAEAVLQLLMESDVEGMIGAGVTSAAASAPPGATATATARSTPGSARCSCASRSCGIPRSSALIHAGRRGLSMSALRQCRW